MKQLLVFLLLLCSASVSAQDVIVKKDGSTVVCRVVELTESEIVYKKWSDLNGSNYVMERSAASAINYQNGKKVNLSEATNLYKPNNQNDGVQQYNDKALLALDMASKDPYKKVKKLKTIGWIGGGALVIIGGIVLADGNSKGGSSHSGYEDGLIAGGVIMGCGVAFTTTFLLLANHEKKKTQWLLSSTIYQYDLKFDNGSTLSTGIDILSDRSHGNNTLGLGLRYNF